MSVLTSQTYASGGQALYAPFPNPVYLSAQYTNLTWGTSGGTIGTADINIPGVGTGTIVLAQVCNFTVPDNTVFVIFSGGTNPNTLTIRTNTQPANPATFVINVVVFKL
jgi:hypothetical protein